VRGARRAGSCPWSLAQAREVGNGFEIDYRVYFQVLTCLLALFALYLSFFHSLSRIAGPTLLVNGFGGAARHALNSDKIRGNFRHHCFNGNKNETKMSHGVTRYLSSEMIFRRPSIRMTYSISSSKLLPHNLR
jgi:hypothetical protein